MIALLLACALADERKNVEVTCPADGHKFTAIEVVSTNDWGGVDRDFCRHAYKTRPMELYVWVCPKCFFAGRKRDFEGTAKKVELKPAVRIVPGMKQDAIPGWAKYDLMAQTRTALGAPPQETGKAWLSAAWCWREEGSIFLEDFDEWERLWTSYNLQKPPLELGRKNRTDFEFEIVRRIEKDIAAGRHKGLNLLLAQYLCAYLWRRHGENIDALRWLDEAARMKGENSIVDDAVERTRRSIEEERRYQKLALAQLEAATGLDRKSQGEIHYVVAETHRRLGDKAKALETYGKAIEVTPDEALRKLAAEQKSLLEK